MHVGDMAVDRGQAKNITVALEQPRVIRLAQASHRLDKSVKYRLQVERRAADHFEHVGSSSLLLERLAQLVQQPGVLDGDDGLVGEGSDELDLLVGEGASRP